MTEDAELPESDCVEGLPHPRHSSALFGQESAEADFLSAFEAERLHHAWLITGPRGVGKATLAWRIARFLLSDASEKGLLGAADTLETSGEDPILRRIAALSEPRLSLLRRSWNDKTKKLRSEITVEEVRGLKSTFSFAAADGGRRVIIVDSIDDMNTAAANAFLKLLEEPPRDVTMLLISHHPGRLLPTIRSRCRVLRCAPLPAAAIRSVMDLAGLNASGADALAELADGSAGTAMQLELKGGALLYEELTALMGTAPGLDRARAQRLAESCGGRGNEERYALLLTLAQKMMHRLALKGATEEDLPAAAPDEPAMLRRLSPTSYAAYFWAELAQKISARTTHAQRVNLDPSAVVLDMLLQMDAAARHATQGPR